MARLQFGIAGKALATIILSLLLASLAGCSTVVLNANRAAAKLSPGTVNFTTGSASGGVAGHSSTVTLTSTGVIDLDISGIQLTGAHAGSFTQTNTCGASLAPGKSCVITISFAAAATANFGAGLSVYDNAADSPQTVSLRSSTGASGLALDYQMMYLPSYGQSLSQGVDANPAITTTQQYDSLMFTGGVVANANSLPQSSIYSSLLPLVESSWSITPSSPNYIQLYSTVGSTNTGETPISGALDTIKGKLVQENGVLPGDRPYIFVGSAPGKGGQPIATLAKGSVPYQRVLAEIAAAKAFATTAGRSFGVPALLWTQGEGDAISLPGSVNETSTAQYAAMLTTLFNNFNQDIKAITGQTKDVQFIEYQTFGGPLDYGPPAFNIAVAQLQVAQAMPNVHIGTPCYPIQPVNGGDVHLSPAGSRQLGAYCGTAYKRIVVDGDSSYAPLTPLAWSASGATIQMTVSLDQTPIQIDTTNYTSQTGPLPNYGFQLSDAAGKPVTIAVTITGPDSIQIVASQPIATGFTLTYGASPDGVHGGWGNIRDSQGTIDTVTIPGGSPMPLHNWLRQFSHTF